MVTAAIDVDRHPLGDDGYVEACRARLHADGALVLAGFFTAEVIERLVAESAGREGDAFHADSTHNVYLTAPDPALAPGHPFNRQVASSKGLIADDQIPADSPLRAIYGDPAFRAFLCAVLGVAEIHPYADDLSSINVHFAAEGRELGWHFDNSSFAVTMLLQAPEGGGVFEYVPGVRDAETGDQAYDRVGAVLDGGEPVLTLAFDPGDLVLFRGRDALHRVTPTEGATTRMLVVFAFNDRPGVGLSTSALRTFYGRIG
ncbi:MAG: 2OG-Fe(II) oxygenase [Actinomycetota bacterium]